MPYSSFDVVAYGVDGNRVSPISEHRTLQGMINYGQELQRQTSNCRGVGLLVYRLQRKSSRLEEDPKKTLAPMKHTLMSLLAPLELLHNETSYILSLKSELSELRPHKRSRPKCFYILD